MATVSGKYTYGASGVGGSSRGAESDLWSHAVPVGDEEEISNDTTLSTNDSTTPHETRQPSTVQSTTVPKTKMRSVRSRTGLTSTPSQRSTANTTSESGYANLSEPDNLADSVPNPYSRMLSRERDHSRHRGRRKHSRGAVSALDTHLSQAEIDQMFEDHGVDADRLPVTEAMDLKNLLEQHGMLSRLPSRANSRKSKSTRAQSVMGDEMPPQTLEEEPPVPDIRAAQLLPAAELSAQPDDQSPLVLQEDGFATRVSQRAEGPSEPARPTTSSRIPISKMSPVAASGSRDENGLAQSPTKDSKKDGMGAFRARSASAGSQNLLNNSQDESSTQISPKKSKVNEAGAQSPNSKSKTAKSNGVNKTVKGRDVSGQQHRKVASNDSMQRPKTRDGSRPPTARPEGEAPWIATMYKPDPMLPPDQQILPTHAKRLAMEREAKERRSSPTEQSEFTLLDPEDSPAEDGSTNLQNDPQSFVEPQRAPSAVSNRIRDSLEDATKKRDSYHGNEQQQSFPSPETNRESGQWPLRSPSNATRPSPRSDTGSFNNNGQQQQAAGVSEHGGHKSLPTIHSSPTEKSRVSQQRERTSQQKPVVETKPEGSQSKGKSNAPTRLPEAPEEEPEKKKGCAACCAVM